MYMVLGSIPSTSQKKRDKKWPFYRINSSSACKEKKKKKERKAVNGFVALNVVWN